MLSFYLSYKLLRLEEIKMIYEHEKIFVSSLKSKLSIYNANISYCFYYDDLVVTIDIGITRFSYTSKQARQKIRAGMTSDWLSRQIATWFTAVLKNYFLKPNSIDRVMDL